MDKIWQGIEKNLDNVPDISVREFYEKTFNLDFLTEEEKETIFTATELYARGRTRFLMSKVKELENQLK